MINSILDCSCLKFFTQQEEEVNYNVLQNLENPDVILDVSKSGQDVVIVKNGRRLCGTGGALSNVPIIQNKAYFEVKVQASGSYGIGLATRKVSLNNIPLGNDSDSWVLRNDGGIYSNGFKKFQISQTVDEGDIIGVTYDHELLNFYINGDDMECAITGIRGTVYPSFFVDDGAILDVQFNAFYHQPPIGFDRILLEKTIL